MTIDMYLGLKISFFKQLHITYPADPPKRNLIDIGGVIAGGLLEDMLSLFFIICRQI